MKILAKKYSNLSIKLETNNNNWQILNLFVEVLCIEIIKTTENETISKAFLEDRIEPLGTDDILENKPPLEKSCYYFTEKSKQLLKTLITISLNP